MCAFFFAQSISLFAQGPLTPPGAPAPTMKTLDQVEPRTLIKALPFTAAGGGSYYLTASLTGTSGQNGITVAASNVTIDLNGFELIGAGAGTGIFLNGGISNVTIRSGTIRNWGSYGINGIGNAGVRVEKVVARNNSGSGAIVLDQKAMVSDCLAESNASQGIYVLADSIVRNCQATGTTGSPGVGISLGDRCALSACTSGTNANNGISAGASVTIGDCVASNNGNNGIFTGTSSAVRNCVATGNEFYQVSVASGIVTDCKCADGHSRAASA